MAHAASGGGRDQVERLTGQPEVIIHPKTQLIDALIEPYVDECF